MRALIDTNIIIDFIARRIPWYNEARIIVDACDRNLFDGCIAAHSIPDIYYILRKSVPVKERREALRLMCGIFKVVVLDRNKLVRALADDIFPDFEDCLSILLRIGISGGLYCYEKSGRLQGKYHSGCFAPCIS